MIGFVLVGLIDWVRVLFVLIEQVSVGWIDWLGSRLLTDWVLDRAGRVE